MQNIRKYRKLSNITSAELAKAVSLTPQAIVNYENGIRQPDVVTLQKIAEYLHVSMEELVCGEVPKKNINIIGLNDNDIDQLNGLANYLRDKNKYEEK